MPFGHIPWSFSFQLQKFNLNVISKDVMRYNPASLQIRTNNCDNNMKVIWTYLFFSISLCVDLQRQKEEDVRN